MPKKKDDGTPRLTLRHVADEVAKLTRAIAAFEDRLTMVSGRMTELFRGAEMWDMAESAKALQSMKEYQILIYQQIEELNRKLAQEK